MKAIDTNIVVRFLTGDDPVQSALARDLIDREKTLVTTTVILETEWVLRSAFGLSRQAIIAALRDFVAHVNVSLVDEVTVETALSMADQGFELADAIHLVTTAGADRFATFDKKMANTARRLNIEQVELLT